MKVEPINFLHLAKKLEITPTFVMIIPNSDGSMPAEYLSTHYLARLATVEEFYDVTGVSGKVCLYDGIV